MRRHGPAQTLQGPHHTGAVRRSLGVDEPPRQDVAALASGRRLIGRCHRDPSLGETTGARGGTGARPAPPRYPRRAPSTTRSTRSCSTSWPSRSPRRPASRSSSATARTSSSATSSSPGGRRSDADVFLTENSPAMSLVESKDLFATLEQTEPSTASRSSTARTTTVDRLRRPLHRPRVRQGRRAARRPARLDPGPRGAGVEGTHLVQPIGRGLPGDRQPPSSQLKGEKATAAVAGGHRRERHRLRRQQRGDRTRSTTARSIPGSSTTTTGTATRRRPARTATTPRCTSSATRTPAPSSASPARACSRPARQQKDAQRFVDVPHRRRGPAGDLADSYALEYPLNPEVDAQEPPVKPLSELEPPRSTCPSSTARR